eukprot:MONOS_12994.1-p1 / transcript=MONOS_12994.1 / gene=MONOS_12994 / organism=Monocercomonoides_exilis_PA203 / gene_product=rRNA metabolism protein, SBDS family / transcript_product=rRNA metabolism protein, SBDS family / location=Mono_scaffold00764:12520-13341(-) / protein_length=240 / sequence_SO=supercontig / SO=protein_coding / is_pseudo=false
MFNRWKEGKLGLDNVLVSEEIYKNHSKMERASESEIEAVVGSLKGIDAIKEILTKGEIALTTAERREKVEQKRREILNFIHSYYVDPSNSLPHPITRLETAMESFRYIVDPFKDAEDQALEVVDKMKGVLPLKKNVMEGSLFIPHAYVAQSQGIIKKWADKSREKWDHNGCTMDVSIVPGNYDKFMQELAKVTHGEHQLTLASSSSSLSSSSSSSTRGGRGRGGRGGGGRGGRGGRGKGK